MMTRRRLSLAIAAACCAAGVAGLAIYRWSGVAVHPLEAFAIPPPPADPAKLLRPALSEALGYGPPSPWDRRVALIRKLPPQLTQVETEALLTALAAPRPADVSGVIHSNYLHEIATILQGHAEVRQRFAQALATLARDPQRGPTTRDYAIQHLRMMWSHAADDPALRKSIVATFHEFTKLDGGISTSALLSLHLLGTPGGQRVASVPAATRPPSGSGSRTSDLKAAPPLSDADLLPLLQPIFGTKTSVTNMPARMTAIRIAGERRLAAFREPMLSALQDRSEHTLVRMAAAHALGEIANPADLATLAALDPGDNRVAVALQSALQSASTR